MRRRPLAFILIFLGLSLLALFWRLQQPYSTSNQSISEKALAVLEVLQGQVLRQRLPTEAPQELRSRAWVYSGDRLDLAPESEAVLDFQNGARVKLMARTQIGLREDTGGSATLSVFSGAIEIQSFGPESFLWISENSSRISAMDHPSARSLRLDSSALGQRQSPKLTQKMIQDSLKKTRPQFYRCYSQLLQKSPGLVGQASLAFEILPTGKVQRPEVSTSTLSDSSFKQCLLSVIQRLEFPSFEGSPVSTLFPLRFD